MSAPLLARLAVGALCLFYASHGAAQSASVGSIDGRVQLQLQSSLVEYNRLTSEADSDTGRPEAKTVGVQFGSASRLGLAVGYGFSNRLQLHVLAGFAMQVLQVEVDDSDMNDTTRQVRFELMPSLRFVGTETSATRIYWGLGIGMTGGSNGGDDDDLEVSARALQVGGTVGAYRFVNSHFSIDPGVELYYVKSRSSVSFNDGQDDQTVSGSGLRLLLTVGLSGWFGANPSETCEREGMSPEQSTAGPAAQPKHLESLLFRTHLGKLVLEVRGNPEADGSALNLTLTRAAGAKSWDECRAFLVNDRGKHALVTNNLTRSGGYGRRLESAHALESVQLLERWLESNPRIDLCGEQVTLPLHPRDELTAALEQFKRVAIAAGTRAPLQTAAPVAVTPEPPASAEEPLSPPVKGEPTPAVAPGADDPPAPAAPTAPPASPATPAPPTMPVAPSPPSAQPTSPAL
jgi:outer membrane protein W